MKDPIVQEVRDARADVAADFGFDLHKFFTWAKMHTAAEREAKHWLPTDLEKTPENVKAVAGPFPGTIKISCKAVYGAKFYPVEARSHGDPAAAWVQVSVDSKCRQTIGGLTPGVEYALRMAAKRAAGQSPWGDETVCRAP